jgi:membrane protein implicated in regulation of membrane protease activity
MIYVWLAVVVLAIVAEAITTDLIAIWIMPAALVSMILAIVDVPLWIQIVAFIVLVAVFLALSKTFLRKCLQKRPNEITNAKSLLGQTAIVTETLNNLPQSGAVRINGLEWSARSVADESVIEKGSLVVIREIRGVKLICEVK